MAKIDIATTILNNPNSTNEGRLAAMFSREEDIKSLNLKEIAIQGTKAQVATRIREALKDCALGEC